MLAQILIALSASIILFLGTMHLAHTFFGNKFDPRDQELKARLQAVSPVFSRQTTMWRAWVGFNASHSGGAMFFGVVYVYLALLQPAFLMQSYFLIVLGLVFLLAFLALAKRYWFSIPFRGIALALVCYVAGFALALT